MGIIIKQSFWNMIFTYLGFAIGAVNTLFLYTHFFSSENYGLVMSLVSLSALIMPFIASGMNNALLRFLPTEKDKNALLTFSLCVPLVVISVISVVLFLNLQSLKEFFPQGDILGLFVPLAVFIALCSAYFEIFYGYAQSHLRSTEGVFLKEMFYRIATTILLLCVYLGWMDEIIFCYCLSASFGLRLIAMIWVSYRCEAFRIVKFSLGKYKKVITYGLFSSMGMAIWAALLEFDKTMLPFYRSLTDEAYYTIAVFIGMTVAVPYRSLYQIVNPMLAKAISTGDIQKQQDLSYKTSINSLILCGGLFLLINCNIDQIYALLPEGYQVASLVVLIISTAKLLDSACGLSGSFIVFSKHYKWDLVFSFALMGVIVGSNMYFIPHWGINGAALSTLLSLLVINSLRLGFVYRRMGNFPFKMSALYLIGLIVVMYFGFYLWSFNFGVSKIGIIASIVAKSVIISIFFGIAIIKLKISKDISDIFSSFFSAKK